MEGVGDAQFSAITGSASAEMNPDHDSLSEYSSHHKFQSQEQYTTYLMPDSGDPDDLNNNLYNYTPTEGEILMSNETQQCWWNGSETVCEAYDDMYSLGFKIAIAILYNSIFVTALLGNALVCYVVFSSPRMRTVTNYLIANLAVGDLLMAVLCVPFSYIPVLLQYWPFGRFLCYLLSPAQAISVLVSSYTLVALAADRYMAILYPLRPRFRRSQACWVIAVVWLIAIITASPIAIFTTYTEINDTGPYYCEEAGWRDMGAENFKLPYGLTLMILQYFFPLTVLIFTYSRIAMAVWGKKSLGEAEDSRDQRLAKTKRKMIKMMLTVVFVYTISWLPFNIFLVYGDIQNDMYEKNKEILSCIYPVIHSLAMAHTVWNPLIYCYMNSRFREGFKAAVSKMPCFLKIVCFCQMPRWRHSRSGRMMTDSARRRVSYYSHSGNTRLTRTNTTCTTYTFGSGSLHNIHNHINGGASAANIYHNHHHQHHNYAINNPLGIRQPSYLHAASNGNGSLAVRGCGGSVPRPNSTCSSIVVSPYPKPNQLSISTSSSIPTLASGGGSVNLAAAARAQDVVDGRNGCNTLKHSNTMTSLAPGQSSSVETSPSSSDHDPSDSFAVTVGNNGIRMSCLKHKPTVKSNGIDLNSSNSCNGNSANGKKKVSLKRGNSGENGAIHIPSPRSPPSAQQNGPSYASIFVGNVGRNGVITTSIVDSNGKCGKSKPVSAASSSSSITSNGTGKRSFFTRKPASNASSCVSESFM